MTKREGLLLLVQAIEDIEHNWASGDLAGAVRGAIESKEEVCKQFGINGPRDEPK